MHVQQVRKLLVEAEMRARREKNLCYNCDEIYTPGRRYKVRQFYMIMIDEEEVAYAADARESKQQVEEVETKDMIASLTAVFSNVG